MQRSYSIFVMLRHTMSLSAFLEFSSNTSEFFFFPLIISLTFRLVFLLLCLLSRISFNKLTTMKAQYPQIHTKQLTHPFPQVAYIMNRSRARYIKLGDYTKSSTYKKTSCSNVEQLKYQTNTQ